MAEQPARNGRYLDGGRVNRRLGEAGAGGMELAGRATRGACRGAKQQDASLLEGVR